MSVCDVPLCANISVGTSQPLMGVPKGIPRVNCVQTRQRLRNRLHKKRETLRENAALINRAAAQQNAAGGTTCLPSNSEDGKPNNDDYVKRSQNIDDIPNLARLSIKTVTKINEETGDVLGMGKTSRLEDIDTIMNFIEGKENDDQAVKKAAKKARQKMKKEVERLRKEKEEADKRRKEEEKKRQEEKMKELLAKQQLHAAAAAAAAAAKKGKNKKNSKKGESRKNDKSNKYTNNVILEQQHFEETIPAMVTIKRIVENNNCPPTVTITLKGSTPDQDKLLFTLVNGHNDVKTFHSSKHEGNCKDSDKNNRKKKNNNNSKENDISTKTNGKHKDRNIETVTSKQLKVTLAVDKSFRKELELKCQVKNRNKAQKPTIKEKPIENEQESVKSNKARDTIDIHSLKLPPGITITKVNGPLTNKKTCNVQSSEYPSNVPVNKSGVIVVDTEKLIQQSTVTKKGKKKKKKSQQAAAQTEQTREKSVNKETMVTLINPVFQNNKLVNHNENIASSSFINMNEQATISQGADGMVTIRRPHPISLADESPMSEYLTPNIAQQKSPSPLSLEQKIIRPPSPRVMNSYSKTPEAFDEHRPQFTPNVLLGLPGIQVTRVNRNAPPMEPEQKADVSIIRTGGFNLDKDDWPYESVFKPKDILEDELDAEEREIEAFKRFCEQSVPPKHKEKVALNVKDIVLMKKNDVTYS